MTDADFSMENNLEKQLKSLPDIEIPKSFLNTESYLRKMAINGLEDRYLKESKTAGKEWEKIKKRAEYELDIIISNGFANYFLIVMDYVNWAIKYLKEK